MWLCRENKTTKISLMFSNLKELKHPHIRTCFIDPTALSLGLIFTRIKKMRRLFQNDWQGAEQLMTHSNWKVNR